MKNILFAISLLMVSLSGFSQDCGNHDYECKSFIDSVSINGSVTLCFAPGFGVNDIGGGAFAVPAIDTAYVKTQSGKGNAYFISPTCLKFDAYNIVGTAEVTYVVVIDDSCHSTIECIARIAITCPTPLANDDNLSAYTNVANFPLGVTANDNLYSSSLGSITVIKNPTNGVATVAGANINFSGNNIYSGLDTLVYVLTNECGKKDTATVILNIQSCLKVNAINDLANLVQGTMVSTSVLANDTNTAYGTPVVSIIKTPKGGVATVAGTSIAYTGNNNFFGLDSVIYSVCTDCGCDTALLLLNVSQAPCTAPTAIVDQFFAGYLCSSTFNVLRNDINPIGGGNAVVTLASTPAYGTATVVNNQVVYTVTDTTKKGFIDSVFYSLCNDCVCDTAKLSIVITNNPCNGIKPTIVPDYTSVCRNDSVWVKVTANDFDLEGSYVTLTDTNGNSLVGQPKFGTVVKVDSVTLLYIPNLNYFGVDTFVYQGGDNGIPRLYDQAQVFVTVGKCDNPPMITDKGVSVDTLRITIAEDGDTTLCLTYTDADGDWVNTSPNPSIDTIVSIPTGDSPTPCLGITPPHDYVGVEGVWVRVCDEYPKCDSVFVIITVTPRQDAPVATPDVISYNWSLPCNGTNVLTNDYDVDVLDSFTISTFATSTTHGGTVTQTSDSVLCYTANPSFTGVDTFTYVICDTSNLCDTTFVVVNVPLIARPDNYTINQEQETLFDVKANDTRFDGEQITLCGEPNGPKHGTAVVENGQVKYTPADDYPYDPITDNAIGNGLDSFCYTLCNAKAECSTTMVYVTIIPKPKFFIPEGFSPSGDGTNDKFVIVSAEEYPQSQLLVYNRWGDEVWRNDSGYQNDFDGNYKKNGAALPDGTYYYIFKFNKDGVKDRVGYIVINR